MHNTSRSRGWITLTYFIALFTVVMIFLDQTPFTQFFTAQLIRWGFRWVSGVGGFMLTLWFGIFLTALLALIGRSVVRRSMWEIITPSTAFMWNLWFIAFICVLLGGVIQYIDNEVRIANLLAFTALLFVAVGIFWQWLHRNDRSPASESEYRYRDGTSSNVPISELGE